MYEGKKEKKRKDRPPVWEKKKKRGAEVGTKSQEKENVGTTEKFILLC